MCDTPESHYTNPATWLVACLLCLPVFALSLCAAVLGMGASAGMGQSDTTSLLVGVGCCLAVVSSFAVMLATQEKNPGQRQ